MWFLFATSLMFSGCGPKKLKLPCWVTSPCGDYNENEYILGVGTAESQPFADDVARAEVAKRFQVQISQIQSSEKEAQSFSTEEGINMSSRQSLQTNTVASVALELQGVEIVSRHEEGVLFYSLAVLERAPMLSQIDERLSDLDEQSRTLIVSARESSSKLDRAAAYHRAIPLLDEMELLNQRRVVVHPKGNSWDFFATSTQVRHEEEDTFRTINIQLTADNTAKDVLPTLIEDLTLRGFSIVQNQPDLMLTVEGTESMLPPDTFGFSQTRLSYLLKVVEPQQNNRVVLERALIGEAASQDLFKARQFALKNIVEDLSKEMLSAQLKGVILGEDL